MHKIKTLKYKTILHINKYLACKQTTRNKPAIESKTTSVLSDHIILLLQLLYPMKSHLR